MAKQCLVYNVFIAFPSDVLDEVKTVKEVVRTWNSDNYETFNVQLRTIDWKTDSYPEMNKEHDPQGIVNKQVLQRGDILIGIFWCRIGTQTKHAISGTVEEIDTFVNDDKPTLLYFSSKPVNPYSIDQSQLDCVKEVKKKYQQMGIFCEFASLDELKDTLYGNLTNVIRALAVKQEEILKEIEEEEIINNNAETQPIKELLAKTFEDLGNIFNGKSKYISTGFYEIDTILEGLQQKSLYLIAGDRYGKTTFLKSLIINICINNKIPCGIFINDGNGDWFSSSLLSSVAGLNPYSVSRGLLKKRDLPRLSFAAGPISVAPLFVNDSPGMTYEEFEKNCIKLHGENKIRVLFIDNLQMFNCYSGNNSSIALITKSLKALSAKLNIAIVITSKLDEKNNRIDKRPYLSDLKEKYGDIEDYTDTIIFLYHDSYENNIDRKCISEFIVAKSNRGPIGTARLLFDRDSLLFKNNPNVDESGGF